MLPSLSRAVPLFTVSGIAVSIHWTWFLVAAYSVQNRADEYSSLAWNVAEYLGLFLLVLLHEFGHAFACRQTGGVAKDIILWPFGGIALVSPPPRPGAQLWSIAAGPLVNLVLAPVLVFATAATAESSGASDLNGLLYSLSVINFALLIFNLLPVYPLDGGQILRSVLWFFTGPAVSLAIAAGIGVVVAVIALAWTLWTGQFWLALMALFIASTAFGSLRLAVNR
jgi:Zn-dependent protease